MLVVCCSPGKGVIMKRRTGKTCFLMILALAAASLWGACYSQSQEQAEQPMPSPESTGLPEGHPPLDQSSASPGSRPAAGGGGVLVWTAPEGWVAEEPKSAMRNAQYRVPGAGGDAECVVFYFGAGQGGDPMANAQRWAGQFVQPDGSSSLENMSTEEMTTGDIDVLLVRVKGTYQAGRGMGGPGEPRPGYALFGAVARGPDASWFFKLTGPEATVDEQSGAFRELVESLRVATSP
jgi:hypothetical protein